jgi:hypothetical protein
LILQVFFQKYKHLLILIINSKMATARHVQVPAPFGAKQSWQQKAKFFAIAGTGFFADGYLNLTIGLGTY